jgi:hypothetical protein
VRKRIVIGVIAVVLVGVIAYVIMQPRKGTAEYHKKEYRAAREKMYGVKWYSPVTRVLGKVVPVPQRRKAMSYAEVADLQRRQDAARDALIKVGYLVEKKFTVTNHPASSLIEWVLVASRDVIPQETRYYSCVLLVQSNVIVMAATAEDLPRWEELIRKADVPE